MIEPLKKTLLVSLGVVAFTKAKLEQIVKEMVERGELSCDQGKNVLSVLFQRGDGEGTKIVEKITKEVERWLARGPLATRGELRSLQDRLTDIESQLASAVDGQGGNGQ